MFTNVRLRLQRMTDAKFFNGWVSSFDGKELYFKSQEPTGFEPGTAFHVTINGFDVCAQFMAVSFSKLGDEDLLYVSGGIRYTEAVEDVRYAVDGIVGTLVSGGTEYIFEVADISRKGLGGFCHGQISRGEIARFSVDTPYGQVSGDGEVRYCRPDSGNMARSRLGLEIKQIGRIDLARWHRLIGDESVMS